MIYYQSIPIWAGSHGNYHRLQSFLMRKAIRVIPNERKVKKKHFLWSLINGVGGWYLMENTYRDIKVSVSNDVTSRVLHPCQNCKVNSLQSKYGLTSCDT